jgi:pyruvate dehydrogenase E1 component alpha subunit
MGAHSSSDDPSRYRTASDLEPWAARDPIARFQQRLRERGALSEQQESAIHVEAEQRAGQMRQRVTTMPVPDAAATIFDHVYSAPPAGFRQERDAFAASLEGPAE